MPNLQLPTSATAEAAEVAQPPGPKGTIPMVPSWLLYFQSSVKASSCIRRLSPQTARMRNSSCMIVCFSASAHGTQASKRLFPAGWLPLSSGLRSYGIAQPCGDPHVACFPMATRTGLCKMTHTVLGLLYLYCSCDRTRYESTYWLGLTSGCGAGHPHTLGLCI
jgi:hypothetical protein